MKPRHIKNNDTLQQRCYDFFTMTNHFQAELYTGEGNFEKDSICLQIVYNGVTKFVFIGSKGKLKWHTVPYYKKATDLAMPLAVKIKQACWSEA